MEPMLYALVTLSSVITGTLHSELSLRRIEAQLPAMVQKIGWADCIPVSKTPPGLTDYYTHVQYVRRVSEREAKILLTMHAGDSVDKPFALLTIHLSYYDRSWSIRKHEESRFFQDSDERERLLRFLFLIEKCGG